MSTIKVTFKNYQNLTLASKHAFELAYNFNWVDSNFVGGPEELVRTQRAQVKIGISETLAAMWGLLSQDTITPSENLIKITFEFSKRYLIERLKDGTLTEKMEFWLSYANQPKTLPFDPSRIDFKLNDSLEVKVANKRLMTEEDETKLASSIISTRDNINAIFKDKFGEKLLLIDQERSLLELFRSANTEEEFSYRVAALGKLITNMNLDILRKETQTTNKEIKSIELLNKFLRIQSDKVEDLVLVKVLKNLNKLRQGYPVHGDNIGGLIEAHTSLDLDYPLKNFKVSWVKLMSHYSNLLENLLQIIKNLKWLAQHLGSRPQR